MAGSPDAARCRSLITVLADEPRRQAPWRLTSFEEIPFRSGKRHIKMIIVTRLDRRPALVFFATAASAARAHDAPAPYIFAEKWARLGVAVPLGCRARVQVAALPLQLSGDR